ncbi:pirin family protein [Methanofollis ethanolicus]|uniref:pirin family protein n=1 Tax=Methanofollis ethanolicus TaxID=488124 RepID=UPI001F36F1A6|nr:pirin-like C-terminal cupin domain-containing protein [Methanofollis ethanolicus]
MTDRIGNAGTIGAGDVQWMTAGVGFVYPEMPKPVGGKMGGFQFRVNLPRSHRMMEPRYPEIRSEDHGGPRWGRSEVRVIAGWREGVDGPVREIVAEPDVFDVTMAPGAVFVHGVRLGHTVYAYVIGGSGRFGALDLREYQCALFGDGDEGTIGSPLSSLHFLFFSGRPIREPIAGSGSIVMNTNEELEEAFREYREGTFVRAR